MNPLNAYIDLSHPLVDIGGGRDETVLVRRPVPLKTFGLALALWAWIAPASAQTTSPPDFRNLDFSQAKPDLSKYSTYYWSKDQVAVVNLANHVRLVGAIQKQMKELGYRIDTVKPDLLIRYKADRRTDVHARSSQAPSVWDPTDMKVRVELDREEQVSLEILLVEAESGFVVWQAKGTYPLGTPDKAEKLINEAVEGLFAEYPTKKTKGDGED